MACIILLNELYNITYMNSINFYAFLTEFVFNKLCIKRDSFHKQTLVFKSRNKFSFYKYR